MPVHEVHALADGFGVFHAWQASPECPQVDFQDILLIVFQCCTQLSKVPTTKFLRAEGRKDRQEDCAGSIDWGVRRAQA